MIPYHLYKGKEWCKKNGIDWHLEEAIRLNNKEKVLKLIYKKNKLGKNDKNCRKI